jgi:hypothetical protein
MFESRGLAHARFPDKDQERPVAQGAKRPHLGLASVLDLDTSVKRSNFHGRQAKPPVAREKVEKLSGAPLWGHRAPYQSRRSARAIEPVISDPGSLASTCDERSHCDKDFGGNSGSHHPFGCEEASELMRLVRLARFFVLGWHGRLHQKNCKSMSMDLT